MNTEDQIKLLLLNAALCESAITDVERSSRFEVLPARQASQPFADVLQYVSQFDESLRRESRDMSRHYQLFYCLERFVRDLVIEKLTAEVGPDWWANAVPENVRQNAEKNQQRELDSAMSSRSGRLIDYTTFGELGEIVRQNWARFADTFNSQSGFSRVMQSLNLLRGPIAHCYPLAPDEVDRLNLTIKDLFRLME